MNELMIGCGEDITVSIDGEKLPLVESVSEECSVELHPVRVFGEADVRQYLEKGRSYTVRITRLPGAVLPESFTLTLDDGTKSVSFYGCRCLKCERVSRVAEPVRETVTVVSGRREENP